MQTVGDVLKRKGHQLHTIEPGASVQAGVQRMLEHKVSSLAVVDGGQLVGIFTKNDIVRQVAADPRQLVDTTVAEHMKTDLTTASESDGLDAVAALMVERGIRHLPVLRDGQPVGVITMVDVLERRVANADWYHGELEAYIRGTYPR